MRPQFKLFADVVVTVLRRVAFLKLQMDPSRAVRSGVALGTNCAGDGAEGIGGGGGGGGGGENSIKPGNIKIK
jgi:hypothetical protein